MIAVSSVASPEGNAALLEAHGHADTYRKWLRTVVADAFEHHTGQVSDVHLASLTPDIVQGLCVPLSITIHPPWSASDSMKYYYSIRRDIRVCAWTLGGVLSATEVHIIALGDPSVPRIITQTMTVRLER